MKAHKSFYSSTQTMKTLPECCAWLLVQNSTKTLKMESCTSPQTPKKSKNNITGLQPCDMKGEREKRSARHRVCSQAPSTVNVGTWKMIEKVSFSFTETRKKIGKASGSILSFHVTSEKTNVKFLSPSGKSHIYHSVGLSSAR